MKIRPAEFSDIPAITRIYAHAVKHGTASFELEPPDEPEMTRRMKNAALQRARAVFGSDGAEERRLAQFLISEVPVAAVRDHLKRGEAPPPIVDRMIRTTYTAVVADYRARKG